MIYSRPLKRLFIGLYDPNNRVQNLAREMNKRAGNRVARVWTLERSGDLSGPPIELDGDLPAGLIQWVRWGLDELVLIGDDALLEQMTGALRMVGATWKREIRI